MAGNAQGLNVELKDQLVLPAVPSFPKLEVAVRTSTEAVDDVEAQELGMQQRFDFAFVANQEAYSRVVAARAARLAQWRLATDELETLQAEAVPTVNVVKVGGVDAASLTADRDLWRPGWQADEEEPAPPRPSDEEAAEGRRWLRSSFGPGSPWAKWAKKKRRQQK